MIQEYLLTFPQEVLALNLSAPSPATTALSRANVAQSIQTAEIRFLLPLLGEELFNDMLAERNNVPSSYPSGGPNVAKFPTKASYEELWKRYLWNYTGQAVLLEATPFIHYKVTQAGVQKDQTEYSKHGGKEGLGAITDRLQQRLDALEEQIKKYICENRDGFPLYDFDENCDCGCEACGYRGYIYKLNKKLPCSCTSKNSRSGIIFY